MAHSHALTDSDISFNINPITRTIQNSSSKTTIIQNDHNSERLTFTLPKFIDGHDMSQCNAVQVHYLNIDSATKEQAAGIYEVDDLTVGKNSETVEFTWLISQNATKYVGSLNFVIRFSCVAGDGTIEYAWHTAVFSGISVSTGILNTEIIAEEYADILEQWKAEILAQAGTGGTGKPLKEWKTDTKYKKGDMCISEKLFKGYPKTILMICKLDHISSGVDEPDNLNTYWDYYTISARNSVADMLNRVIHETYATKDELENIEFPNEITGDFTVTSEFGGTSVELSNGTVNGNQGGGTYKIDPDGIDFTGFKGWFSLNTDSVSGCDAAKSSWQEWLGIGNIETALDNIITLQNQLIGGDA